MRTEKWEQKDIDYAIENRLEKSYAEIGKDIGRTRSAVLVKLNKMGYKLPEKYSYNSDFFSTIDSEEKAYWFGFLWADGYVNITSHNKQTGYTVGVELQKRDIDHLKKFNVSLSGNLKIVIRKRKPNALVKKEFEVCSLRIFSKKMVFDLIKNGLVERKTSILKFPIIEKLFIRHFIRGYFDGNGSSRINSNKNQIRCKFTCASIDFIEGLRKTLFENNIPSYIVKSNNVFDLCIDSKKNVLSFMEYMYDGSTIYLDRKYRFYCDNKYLLEYIHNGYNKK